MAHVTDKWWQWGWGAEKNFLSLSSPTENSISQESIRIFPLSDAGMCEGERASGEIQREQKEEDEKTQLGFSHTRLKVLWRSFSTQGWKSEEKKQEYLKLDKGKKELQVYFLPQSTKKKSVTKANWSRTSPVGLLDIHLPFSKWAQISLLTLMTGPCIPEPPTHPGCCSWTPLLVSP